MTRRSMMGTLGLTAIVAVTASMVPLLALADTGGDAASATDSGASQVDDGAAADSGAEPPPATLACDGSLCATTNGSTCTIGRHVGGGASTNTSTFATALGVLGVALARRGRRPERLQP